MRICVVLPSLGGGGAERLHINLIKEWLTKGHKIDLIVLSDTHDENSIERLVPSGCKIKFLKNIRIRDSLFSLINHFKSNKYNIILAAMWPLTFITIIAVKLSFNKSKVFISEHTVLSLSRNRELNVPEWIIRISSFLFYPLADGIIAVSKGVQKDIVKLSKLEKERVKVIYNPAATSIETPPDESIEAYRANLWNSSSEIRLLAVGTLKIQKGFDILIDAFNQLPANVKEKSELVILGEGPERDKLEQQILDLQLNTKISIPGFQINPYPWFFSASMYVLSSRWEGFGNVLVEALETGLPIVSTNCNSGPAEILQNGLYGELVIPNDSKVLSEAIVKSLKIEHDSKKLINRAKDFSVQKISKEYLDFFQGN